MIDIVEILVHWHAGRPIAVVAESLGTDRKTIRKYVAPAEAAGLAPGGPPLSRDQWAALVRDWFPELTDPRARSRTHAVIDAHRERIADMLKSNKATTVRHRAVEFRKFLNLINRSVPDDLDVHLVVDNVSTHKTPEIKRWLLRHPRFHLHFTPTYSSWINLVERWFAELTNKWLRRGTHRSTKELESAIGQWIDQWNNEPKPFVWHKSADEILDTLATYCQRISDSGH